MTNDLKEIIIVSLKFGLVILACFVGIGAVTALVLTMMSLVNGGGAEWYHPAICFIVVWVDALAIIAVMVWIEEY